MFFTVLTRLFSTNNRCFSRLKTKTFTSGRFTFFGQLDYKLMSKHKGKMIGPILASVLFTPTFDDSDEEEKQFVKKKINIPEPATFSHTFQLQQAASHTINSSITMLNSTLQTLLTAYSEYSNLLELAIKTLNIAIEINPSIYDHTGIDSQLSMLRSDIDTKKSAISETLFVFGESVKLLQAAANISFLVGNEPSSNLAFSHCTCIQQEVLLVYRIVVKS